MHKLVGIIITTCDDDHDENENDDTYIHGESDTRNHCHLVRGVVVVFDESVPTKRVASHQRKKRTKRANYCGNKLRPINHRANKYPKNESLYIYESIGYMVLYIIY